MPQKLEGKFLLLLAVFPMIDIFIAYIFHGDFLETFYSFFSIYLILAFLVNVKLFSQSRIEIQRKKMINLFLAGSCVFFNVFLVEKGLNTAILDATYFVLLMDIYNDQQFIRKFAWIMKKKAHILTLCSFGYLFILLLSILRGNAFSNEWSTTTLRGPYAIPHILAYEFLVMSALNIVLFMESKRKINLILAIIFWAGIMLTAARGAILAEMVMLGYFFFKLGIKKKLVLILFICCVLIYEIINPSIFMRLASSLIEKTLFALESGSLDNGRLNIWISSMNAFLQSNNPLKWLFGIGYTGLLAGNKQNIGMYIQAHNDFITIVVSFGIPYLFLFIRSFIKLVKGKNILWSLLFFAFLAGFNGIVLYMPMVIGCIFLIVFFKYDFQFQRGKYGNH